RDSRLARAKKRESTEQRQYSEIGTPVSGTHVSWCSPGRSRFGCPRRRYRGSLESHGAADRAFDNVASDAKCFQKIAQVRIFGRGLCPPPTSGAHCCLREQLPAMNKLQVWNEVPKNLDGTIRFASAVRRQVLVCFQSLAAAFATFVGIS